MAKKPKLSAKVSTDASLLDKDLSEKLAIIANLMRGVSFPKGQAVLRDELCALLESGELKTTEAGIVEPEFTDETAAELSALLTVDGGNKVEPKDVKNVSSLLIAIKEFSSTASDAIAISSSMARKDADKVTELSNEIEGLKTELEAKEKELAASTRTNADKVTELSNEIEGLQTKLEAKENELAASTKTNASKVAELNSKIDELQTELKTKEDELASVEKKDKVFKRIAIPVMAVLATLGTAATIFTGVLANKLNKTKAELDKARENLTIAETGKIESENALEELGAQLGVTQEQLDAANQELGEVAGIVGAGEGEDISDKTQEVINNNGTVTTDPELGEIKEALGDNYKEGDDLSDVVSDVVSKVGGLEDTLTAIENILTKNNQEVIDGDVAGAVSSLINGLQSSGAVTPEDGIGISDVNDVWNAFINELGELGVTEDSFKDENGSFSLDKIPEALGEYIEDAVGCKATLVNIETRVQTIVEGFEKEDGENYSFEDDFNKDVISAIDFISDEIDRITAGNKEYEEQVQDLKDEIIEIKDSYEDAIDGLKNANQKLIEENESLKEAAGKDANAGQEDTEINEEKPNNSPVGDKEVDNDSNPAQSDKDKTNGSEEDIEPGV